MIELPAGCVVDASVGIKLFIDEEGSEAVRELFERIFSSQSVSLYVPDLFFIECANVLWKKVSRGDYRADLAMESLADLREMEIPATSTLELVERALEIACAFGITACDACYVALAEMKGVPLLTADTRLAGILAGSGHEVVTL